VVFGGGNFSYGWKQNSKPEEKSPGGKGTKMAEHAYRGEGGLNFIRTSRGREVVRNLGENGERATKGGGPGGGKEGGNHRSWVQKKNRFLQDMVFPQGE